MLYVIDSYFMLIIREIIIAHFIGYFNVRLIFECPYTMYLCSIFIVDISLGCIAVDQAVSTNTRELSERSAM